MVLIPVFLLLAPFTAGGEPLDHPDWKYVRKVLLTSETGENEGFIVRWNRPVRVTVVSEDLKNHLSLVRSVIGELNTALAGTGMSLTLVGKTSDILIHFVKRERFRSAGAKLGCEAVPDAVAYFCTWGGNEKHPAINFAFIVIPNEEPTGDFYSMALEELTQVLGPTNDVQDPAFETSLFYEYEEGVSTPYFKVLSNRDKKLLRFLYTHLKPGDREPEVRAAFDKHWDSIQVPD